MLILREGSKVPFPEKLEEGYRIEDNQITANIGADKIKSVLEHFIFIHNEQLFFILELPAKQQEEIELFPGVVSSFHSDVYYIDGLSRQEALRVLSIAGELMIRDGMCTFGFGCHHSKEEILFGKYNVTTIFSEEPDKYVPFFKAHQIEQKKNLVIAWNLFSPEHSGESICVKTDGKTIYDIPFIFADWGIYKAQR